jgi:hypothetical protein
LNFSRSTVVTCTELGQAQFSLPWFFCHSFMNYGLRHFRNDVMQLSYCPTLICANLSFNFLISVIRYQRWLTVPLFVVNISPPFGEFTAPLRHILLIHNVIINGKNLFVNFHWTSTFCAEKPYDTAHLAFGRTLDWHSHFKHISLKHSQIYHCQTSMAHS